MPRRRSSQGRPCDYSDGVTFADGEFVKDAPAGVVEMWGVADGLRRALARQSMSIVELADRASVDRSVIHDVLAGRTYLNAVTLARLEGAVESRLWPDVWDYHTG